MSNTTESITKPKPKTSAELAEETQKVLAKMKTGKQVKVSIPTILQNQLGENLYVGVNGIAVHVPVDGEDHSIPEPHAIQVKEMLKNLK